MRLELNRHNMLIIPKSDADIAYLEDTLGMQGGQVEIRIRRATNYNSRILYVEIVKRKDGDHDKNQN